MVRLLAVVLNPPSPLPPLISERPGQTACRKEGKAPQASGLLPIRLKASNTIAGKGR